MAVVSSVLPRRWRAWRLAALGRAAMAAGTVVRWSLSRRSRVFARMVPGLAGAALAAVGTGEVISHVFGRGLAPWVACVVAAGFLLRMSAELNRATAPPPEPEG